MTATSIPAVKINEHTTCIFTDGTNFVLLCTERWGKETMTYGIAEMDEVFGEEVTMFVLATLGAPCPAE